jgi:hypothetical protein
MIFRPRGLLFRENALRIAGATCRRARRKRAPDTMKKQFFYLCCGLGLALFLALVFRLVFRTGLGWSRAQVTDIYLFSLFVAAILILFFLVLANFLARRRQKRIGKKRETAAREKR